MRLAYFSPLPPQRSGISDYSRELLPYLAAHAEIDLWVDGYKLDDKALRRHRIIDYLRYREKLRELPGYDGIVYHLGNDARYHSRIYQVFLEHPGIVVLHDFALHHFFAGYYLDFLRFPQGYVEEMEYNYGPEGRSLAQEIVAGERAPIWEVDPLRYPLNKRILDHAQGLIVHSEFVKKLVQETHPDLPVRKIHSHSRVMEDPQDREALKARYGIPKDKLILASFGHITPPKRIDKIFKALSRLGRKDVLYLLVGEVVGDVKGIVTSFDLNDIVRVIGYVDLESFKDYMKIADICVNLRYPTMGETSASLCRILGAGKPCIVSNVGWFSELPGDCVAKVDVDESEEDLLVEYLRVLLENEPLRKKIGENAKRYIREYHSPEKAAREYIEFIQFVKEAMRSQRFDDTFIEEISSQMADFGIQENDHRLIEELAREIASLLLTKRR